MRFYVYELIDPRDNSVFYIGKGKGARVDAHEAETRRGASSRKCDRIRQIWASGGAVQKRIVKRFSDEAAAYDFEAQLTLDAGLENLTNVRLGGFGGRRQTSIDLALEEARLAFWCLRKWNAVGRPLWVMIPGHGSICLDEMLAGLGARIQTAVSKAGLDCISDMASRFGVSIEVAS